MSTSPTPTEHRNLPDGQGNESRKPDEMFPSIRGAWEAILFYGGIPTFTVYPLGLTTLYLYQKSIRTYNHTDAWYAISLIPKTTVLGVGAEVLLKSLSYTILSGLFVAILYFSLYPLHRHYSPKAAPRSKLAESHWNRVMNIESPRLRWVAIIASGAILFLVVVFNGRFLIGNATSLVWLPSLVCGLFGAFLLAWDDNKRRELNENAVSKVHHRRWMLRGLTVAYLGALGSAVLAAAYPTDNPDATYQAVDLKLPKAVLDTGKKYACTLEKPCPLLSHSDGYWNIITPEKNDILSIPDDEVTDSKVRVLLGREESTPGEK
jgi:hypothetical protein